MKQIVFITVVGVSIAAVILVGITVVLPYIKHTTMTKAFAASSTPSSAWIQAIGGDVYSKGDIVVNKAPGW